MSKQVTMPEDQPLPRLRQELQVTRQVFDGQPYWVYKDPVSLKYYRFNNEEHFILEQLRAGATLDDLKRKHQQAFRGESLTNRDVAQFISELMSKNMLYLTQPNRDELLYNASHKKWKKKLFSQLSNFMFLKVPLCDPDRVFDKIIGRIRFVWSRWFLLIYLATILMALVLIVRRWHDFSSMFHGNFFTLYNVPVLILVYWLVKAWHELGHGLTCKNYGGEVHEMGFLLLVFAPFLYCNVTDSWTFTDKAHRLLVTSAGILAELMLAALATVVWYYTEQPAFIHAFAFNIIVVCSISTVMFNANPLLRYDGYYIMMDLIEVPNLRQRASDYMKNIFVQHILGGHTDQPLEGHKFHFIFPFYAIAAFLYRWFIVAIIVFFLYKIFEKIHLRYIGGLLVVFSAATMLIMPLVKTGSMLTKQRQSMGISSTRLIIVLSVIVGLFMVILFWPLQQHVTLNFILEPAHISWLRSRVDGTLHWSPAAQEGLSIKNNHTLLAHLENIDLDYRKVKLQSEIADLKLDIDQWKARQDMQTVKQKQERLATLQAEQKRLANQIKNLKIYAPFPGEIISLQEDLKQLQDRYIPQGTALMMYADPRVLQAKVWVPEGTLARIFHKPSQLGQKAEFMLYAFSNTKFYGHIISLSNHRQENMGEFGEKMALSNKVGGEVLTEYDPQTHQEKPTEAVYEVTLNLNKKTIPKAALPYMSGRVRIDCGKFTLWRWTMDSLLRFISPDVRL